jgi:hypothetical protein
MPVIKTTKCIFHHQSRTYFYIIMCLLCLAGCQRNQEIEFKGVAGKLKENLSLNSDTSANVKYKSYYQNGSLKEEGFLLNGKRNGIWKQFYSDGTLRWIGRYRKGRSVVPELDSTVLDHTSINKRGVTPDGYYAFRLKLPDSLSHRDIMYSCTNATLRLNTEYDSSDFDIKPKDKSEAIILKIYAVSNYDDPIFGIKLDSLRLKSNR